MSEGSGGYEATQSMFQPGVKAPNEECFEYICPKSATES